jgi:biopolymer transport protein ExbB
VICGAAALLLQAVAAQGQQAAPVSAASPAVTQSAPPSNAVPVTPAPQVVGPTSAVPVSPAPQLAQSPADAPAAAPHEIAKPSAIGPLHELSPWSMFMSADWLVKVVIVTLMLASLATWTILLAKTIQLYRARRQLTDNLRRITESRSLNEAQLALGATDSILTSLIAAATQEIRMSADVRSEGGIKERAASRFSEIAKIEARAIRYGMGLVATVGATAPFVGLFGTVWGIMNSFIGISKAQTTNLAVVAPGIAEALLATAVGLGAAIPAVIIYNYFSRSTKGYMDLVGRGTGAVGRLLSRDIDRFQARAMPAAAE